MESHFWTKKKENRNCNDRHKVHKDKVGREHKRTYDDLSCLVLILSTKTVMVMPMSTPAANNKAITLTTSLVAICGSGFSTEKKNIKRRIMSN